MGLIGFIKKKWEDWYYHDLDDGEVEDWEEELVNSKREKASDQYFEDQDQRTIYVLECLGQMAEASDKMDQYDAEYQAVTSLLMDMEEVEGMPSDTKSVVMEIAQKTEHLEKERRRLYKKTTQMSDHEIELVERLEGEISSGIVKMKEAEDYRRLIKQDLKKLDGEKKASHMRKRELSNLIANSRGIAIIVAVAMVLCIILMIMLQNYFDMDVRIGYILAGGIGALALTVIYLRYMEAVAEIEKLSKAVNRLISVHNTVKIRYINNTNLLQYLYMKYDVTDSSELEDRWNRYIEETGARQKDEKIREDLEYYYEKLSRILKENGVADPDIWTHQTKALYDKKEMVEVRHALIARRQKIREQMEYNKEIATEAKNSIASLARKYPSYSAEISQIVSRYEGAK